MSRAYTTEEVRDEFLAHVARMIGYWAGEGASNVPADTPTRDRLEGLAFSLLVALDGGAGALPAFVVAPAPHPDDRAFHEARGENYYRPALHAPCDISGSLHERFHAAIRKT